MNELISLKFRGSLQHEGLEPTQCRSTVYIVVHNLIAANMRINYSIVHGEQKIQMNCHPCHYSVAITSEYQIASSQFI